MLLEGLNRFHGANLTLSSDIDQDTYMLGLHQLLKYIDQFIKGDKAKIRTQQYIKPNNGATTAKATGPYHIINTPSKLHFTLVD